VPTAAQQQQQQAPTPAGNSSSSSTTGNQQQQQQQRLVLSPVPRRNLQQWLQLLEEEVKAETALVPGLFNLKEGLLWLAAFAPMAHQQLDEHFAKYFAYIRDKHGPHVLACVVFFCLGHHPVCKGGCRRGRPLRGRGGLWGDTSCGCIRE